MWTFFSFLTPTSPVEYAKLTNGCFSLKANFINKIRCNSISYKVIMHYIYIKNFMKKSQPASRCAEFSSWFLNGCCLLHSLENGQGNKSKTAWNAFPLALWKYSFCSKTFWIIHAIKSITTLNLPQFKSAKAIFMWSVISTLWNQSTLERSVN